MMTARAIHALIVLIALPPLLLRGLALRRYIAIDLATWVLGAIVWQQPHGLSPYLAAVALVVVKIATLSFFLAIAKEVRWSANRAAGAALLVYSLLVPAMQRTPPDGDEPYYLLVTESIVRDFDLDLSNQYRDLSRSVTRRPDLKPQPGDPTGPKGQQYSRHEPFLSILLIPGYLAAGLGGALATIALFAALLARSTVRLLEEEGIDDAAIRLVFPFIAFGPPIVFYAARVWPEVPAAFFFVEGIRGIRHRRAQRWVPALLFLALLKLRFVLVAAPLAAGAMFRARRHFPVVIAIIALPLFIVWLVSGSATNVHELRDVVAPGVGGPLHGLFGLMLDGAGGLLFQAPFYLLGVFAIARWREMPQGFRLGCLASLLYVLLLIPRSEWHGGWSPPLRYIVFLMPVLALGAATLLRRVGGVPGVAAASPALGVAALWTAGLVIHGVAHPWRLFHIANGESIPGEWLSSLYGSDFSRLIPSMIRLNIAAIVAAVLLTAALIAFAFVRRLPAIPAAPGISLVAALLAAGFVAGQQPGARVDFEDAHVQHIGGELHPHEYTVARFAYRGGWILHEGDALSFLAKRGPATLHYVTGLPTVIELADRRYELRPAEGYQTLRVEIAGEGRAVLRCLSGGVNLDRLVSD